jgi:hypothetical protein
MRIIALIGNALVILGMAYLVKTEGISNAGEAWIVLAIVLLPLLNIYVILNSTGNDLISLWFRRKALEEKKKIEKLSDNKS